MKYSLTINGQEHTLELTPGAPLSCRLDGAPFAADVAVIAPGVFSILIAGKSFFARVAALGADGASGLTTDEATQYSIQINGVTYDISLRDPRRWSRARSGLAREGRQQITAPMPGKVVRILVAEKQRVAAGQGMIVVEAMKMQNEIRSRSAGTVEKVLVREGQAVNAGQALLVVE